MKYNENELIRLKTLKETAKKEYQVFISSEEANLGSQMQMRSVLKKHRKTSKRAYYSYKRKYKKYIEIKETIKKYKKELKHNSNLVGSEENMKQTCMDNIIVETMHNSYDDFLLKAVAAYTREQPIRFDTVAPYVLAYEHSSRVVTVHKACINIVNRKLDMLNIELQSI
jgi:hypothetical protein